MRTQAEIDYLRAKAKLKLERQIADREFENRHPAVVAAVSVFAILLMIIGVFLLIIGVFILMNSNPWRSGPAPLQPIPSTTTTWTPTSTYVPPTTLSPTTSTQTPGISCPLASPKPDGTCDLTDWGFKPGDEVQKVPTRKEQCEALQYKPPVCQTLTTEPTQKPDEFPPDVMCKALQYKPPGCATVTPTVPNIPGSRQEQVI